MFIVEVATGLPTVQDEGRPRLRAIGVPPGGAADRAALALGNLVVGNGPAAAGIELAVGEFGFRVEQDAVIAVTGADGSVTVDGRAMPSWRAAAIAAGSSVRIGASAAGRFRYLSIRGGLDVPIVLGSRSTYLPTGLGGWHGRKLRTGDNLTLGADGSGAIVDGPITPDYEDHGPIRLCAGPQGHLFPDQTFAAFEGGAFRTLPASDRMGTRLAGPTLTIRSTALLPSEATAVGAIQVPDSGDPIVVLMDGPTVGGYPKIGAVIDADLDRFAQSPPGTELRFRWVSLGDARRAGASRRARIAALSRAAHRDAGQLSSKLAHDGDEPSE